MTRSRPAADKIPNGVADPVNGGGEKASNVMKEVPKGHADDELVKRVQDGDKGAFRELFDKYNRGAFAVAIGVVKNQQDALDIVQEAFIKVHKHIGSFQGSSSFYTWLYRIVMNLSIDHLRKSRHQSEFDDRVELQAEAGSDSLLPHMEDANPGKSVGRKELSAQIQAALAELPEYHRAVILMREVEGLSYEEMSRVLKVPKGTIMSRLFHARRKMQERLHTYIDGDFKIEG